MIYLFNQGSLHTIQRGSSKELMEAFNLTTKTTQITSCVRGSGVDPPISSKQAF